MNTCSTCKFYHPFHGETKGECWFEPPTVYAYGQSCHPRVRQDEGCSCHVEGQPQAKEKHGGDTPGHAAKAARTKTKPPTALPANAGWMHD